MLADAAASETFWSSVEGTQRTKERLRDVRHNAGADGDNTVAERGQSERLGELVGGEAALRVR